MVQNLDFFTYVYFTLSIKRGRRGAEEAKKAHLVDEKKMAAASVKANGDLNKDKLPRPHCGEPGEESNSSFSAETPANT